MPALDGLEVEVLEEVTKLVVEATGGLAFMASETSLLGDVCHPQPRDQRSLLSHNSHRSYGLVSFMVRRS
jgi:hypothetical protein